MQGNLFISTFHWGVNFFIYLYITFMKITFVFFFLLLDLNYKDIFCVDTTYNNKIPPFIYFFSYYTYWDCNRKVDFFCVYIIITTGIVFPIQEKLFMWLISGSFFGVLNFVNYWNDDKLQEIKRYKPEHLRFLIHQLTEQVR